MENKNNLEQPEDKKCAMCDSAAHKGWCSYCYHRRWFRFLIGLIVLFVVFFVGFKFGELRNSFGRGFYGSSMMMHSRHMMYQANLGPAGNYQVGPGMMNRQPANGGGQQSTTTPQ